MSLREYLALAQLRIIELLRQLQDKPSNRWHSLKKAMAKVDAAIATRDEAIFGRALAELRNQIKEQDQENVLWDRISRATAHKVRLVVDLRGTATHHQITGYR